ncbi:hypothetical protein KsCSTR_21380 [Candidatus Kuenenia stuttgartiensis]|uniref:Uncharacterized protein n=1 Tax=Kuenenia stuttgartiensis TaxID=174633 RepID=A0A6G7GPP4_KUEST|nr:hypothetical protein KsCSTR_21380 [Candidatus Kuenenia stuttgartiensis]
MSSIVERESSIIIQVDKFYLRKGNVYMVARCRTCGYYRG